MLRVDRHANRRSHWLWVVGGSIVVLVGRLAWLQLALPEERQQAERNTVRRLEVLPPRGLLRDRHGRIWVSNMPLFNIFLVPRELGNVDTALLTRVFDLSRRDLEQRFRQAVQFSRTKPSLFFRQLAFERYAALMEQSWRQTGFSAQLLHVRRYLYPVGAHFLGYLSEVTPEEIARAEGRYTQGNLIGRSGIESYYERFLAGRKGYRFVVVDAMGRELYPYRGGTYDLPPQLGLDLVLTVDADLQAFAESLFYGKAGALVAIEPSSGEILCAVSAPTYDPNLLSGPNLSANWQHLQNAGRFPLYNRVVQAMYPPGSTFKLLNALIALQENTLTENLYYPCALGYLRNRGKPACHAHPTPLALAEAIQHSCNAYFASVYTDFLHHPIYQGSIELAYARWRDYMLYFGVGRRLGVDIPSEKPGFLPKRDYYDRLYGKGRWNAFTIISNSIGQGEVLMTPLQMANAMCIIANRGYYVRPHFLKGVYGQEHAPIAYFDTLRVPIDPAHFETVIKGMRLAVEAGTGYTAYVPGLDLCGKTGTAQNPHGRDHSLFVGFAPADKPRIAIAVVVENAGWGATWAAPIASLVVERYLTGKVSRPHLVKAIQEANLLP
ncbi:MAG: penicillin-binding protein 2 [Bacteroidia bacterium]|nr:penicillin-binding protein 2 [Bacteroidia bacterium]MDW8089297.1 penicillin-binding protein 2 [Bacteroidia bacterium]